MDSNRRSYFFKEGLACPKRLAHPKGQTNLTSILSLTSDKFFVTTFEKENFLCFNLTEEAQSYISAELGELLFTSFVKRYIINTHGCKEIIIIPRVAVLDSNGHKRYHRILPDFLIPYTRYTVKSVAACNQELIPQEILDNLPVSEYDELVDIEFEYSKITAYLKRRLNILLNRLSLTVAMLISQKAPVFMKACEGFERICQFYLLTEARAPLRTVSYFIDSLWQGQSP